MMKRAMSVVVVLVMVVRGWAGTPGVDYSFGEWATDAGIPLDATFIDARSQGITRIAADDLAGRSAVQDLLLSDNSITNIEAGAFAGMQNLYRLYLDHNPMVVLNWAEAQFRDFTVFTVKSCPSLDTVDLSNSELSQGAFDFMMDGGGAAFYGLREINMIIEMDYSGADLTQVEQFNRLHSMTTLQQLNLADVSFADSIINDNYNEIVQLVTALEANTLNVLTIDTTLYAARQSYFDDWDSVLFNELIVIPEPCMLSLLGIGALGLLKRRT